MAPEIRLLKPYNGRQVDIFSAGVVLFLLVKGYYPFEDADCDDKLYINLMNSPSKYWGEI